MIHFSLTPIRTVLSALVAACAIGLCTSCEEPPEACFTPSVTLADVNAPVKLENCSERATGYTWDFGDGSTSTEASPTHTFTAEGQYLVAIVAKAKVSANDDTYKTLIAAGQRLFASATIGSLPATNPSGGAWDASDNADIAVRFSQGATVAYQSPTQTDAAWTFPMTVPTPSSTLVLTPNTWTITVLDIDGGSEEVMATFSVNLLSYIPGTTKTIPLTASNSSMSVNYTLR
jgi:hypothetical protein